MRPASLVLAVVPATALPLVFWQDVPQTPIISEPLGKPRFSTHMQSHTSSAEVSSTIRVDAVELPLEDASRTEELPAWLRKWRKHREHGDNTQLEREIGKAGTCFCAGGSICCHDDLATGGLDCTVGGCGL